MMMSLIRAILKMILQGEGVSISRARRGKPYALHSINNRIADKKIGVSLGAEEYLLKPVEPAKLLETVHRYL